MEVDSRENIEKTKEQAIDFEHDDSVIFQSVWIRRNTVLADQDDWKPLARQFRYVLYSGIVLWAVHVIALAIKG